MKMHMNRWTVSLGWIVLMVILAALIVPGTMSMQLFVLLGLVGLVVAFFGSTVLQDSRPPRSMSAILNDLEEEPKTTRPLGRPM